ncbi:MAG TPA: efflux RND transporter periplasmic adaptor subunit [Gammaproteobacteria bacterium]|nr:efflux RND transporter periplasmic adaptor subunit [Gammaproteobacteria bacterium]
MPNIEYAGATARSVAITFVALAFVALAACKGNAPQQPPAPPPTPVAAVEVQPRELALTLEYPAQLRGVREVEVRSRVSGILLERRYAEGEPVKAGDLLFRIDPDPFRAAAARARADLGVQRASFQQATRERDRILPLYEQKLASLRDRDNAVAAYETSQAAVAAAEAALRSAELNLSYTDVRAPIDGVTSREVRSEGSLVTAGDDSSLLTYIVQIDRLYVDFALADGDAALLRKAIAQQGDAVGVRVVDVAGATLAPRAAIEFISPRVDDATGTVAVRAVLDNRETRLTPGRIVRASIEGVALRDTLVIPKRSVMRGAQGAFVWVIGPDSAAAPRPVQLGTSAGNDVAVVSGLAAGDRVVVDGILKMQPGAVVEATLLAADGAPAPAVSATGNAP